jgi:hypothetical protein
MFFVFWVILRGVDVAQMSQTLLDCPVMAEKK